VQRWVGGWTAGMLIAYAVRRNLGQPCTLQECLDSSQEYQVTGAAEEAMEEFKRRWVLPNVWCGLGFVWESAMLGQGGP
jgi:hypothetical protein